MYEKVISIVGDFGYFILCVKEMRSVKYCVYNTQYPQYPEEFQDQDAGTQTPAVYNTEAEANAVCEWLNSVSSNKHSYAVRANGEPVYDRIKEMTPVELRNFIRWVYQQGNQDGRNGVGDSEMGFFGGAILCYSAGVIEHMWNPEVREI